MPLVFRDDCSNLNIPYLVAKGCTVAPRQSFSTSPAACRDTWNDFLTFFRRNQRAFEFTMSRLGALFAFGFCLLLGRTLRVRMFRRWWLRRIARRLIQSSFKFLDLSQQNADNDLRFRRLPSNQICRDLKRHSRVVADLANQDHGSSLISSTQAVNGYGWGDLALGTVQIDHWFLTLTFLIATVVTSVRWRRKLKDVQQVESSTTEDAE